MNGEIIEEVVVSRKLIEVHDFRWRKAVEVDGDYVEK
jgi:hypothetical protein